VCGWKRCGRGVVRLGDDDVHGWKSWRFVPEVVAYRMSASNTRHSAAWKGVVFQGLEHLHYKVKANSCVHHECRNIRASW
jgi:hypothetical protein